LLIRPPFSVFRVHLRGLARSPIFRRTFIVVSEFRLLKKLLKRAHVKELRGKTGCEKAGPLRDFEHGYRGYMMPPIFGAIAMVRKMITA
jgi:hypothetical protein